MIGFQLRGGGGGGGGGGGEEGREDQEIDILTTLHHTHTQSNILTIGLPLGMCTVLVKLYTSVKLCN